MAWKLLNQEGMETDITLYTEGGTTTGGGSGTQSGTNTSTGTNTDKKEENKGGLPGWLSIVIMAVVGVAIVGLFVWQNRKAKKQRKEAEEMMNKLKVGDRVMTIGYICGFIAEINDAENSIVIETGMADRKSYVKVDKGAIYRTAPAQGNAVPAHEAKVETKVEPKEEIKEEVKAEVKEQTSTEEQSK
jgi:preprotein translocase YajC subunit